MVTEAAAFDHGPEGLEVQAGIDVFDKYGELNVLETLSGGDVLKWEYIKALPYEVVFVKRQMNQDKAEFNKNYSELLKQQK